MMRKNSLLYGSLLAALLAEGADLTRLQLDHLLAEVAATPSYVLYCGSVINPAPQWDLFFYRCPCCHTWTPHWCNIHDNQYFWVDEFSRALPALRKSGLCVELDQHEFCRTCCPDAVILAPRAYWLIRIDGKLRKVPIRKYDHLLLLAFLNRKPSFDIDGIGSVLFNLPRLRELVGGKDVNDAKE